MGGQGGVGFSGFSYPNISEFQSDLDGTPAQKSSF